MTYAYGEVSGQEASIVNGLLTSQTYGNGDKVSYTYDDLGRTKTAAYSDGRVLTYQYTGDGQLYSTHDSKTGYTYIYTYDAIGRLIASCVKSGRTVLMQTRQEYNANNQMVAQHWTVGDTTYSQTFTYHKQEGSLTSMSTGNGHTVNLEYDAMRRISRADMNTLDRYYAYADGEEAGQTTSLVSRYWYGNANYDSAYFKYSYTYDDLGNILTYTQNGTAYSYSYDDQSQLLTQTGGGKTYTYTYDNAGNILTAGNGTTTHTYTYGNAVWKDLLTAFDGQRILYEGEYLDGSNVEGKPTSGNPVSYYNGTRWTFDWQEGRNLVSAAAGSNTYEYAYDSNGLRVSKEENGKTHTYLYASGKLLRETISENNVVTDVLDFFYDHSGYPCELNHTANGTTTTYYYITNLQGDVLAMITGNGTVVASYTYDPYGKPLDTPDEDTIEELNPLRYRGYYYDAETGFYYLQSRYYDPAICRFVNADSYVSTSQGIIGHNMFAYCGNNPICYSDPTGTMSFASLIKIMSIAAWVDVAALAAFFGYEFVAELVLRALLGFNGTCSYGEDSYVAQIIASDQDFINDVTEAYAANGDNGEIYEYEFPIPESEVGPTLHYVTYSFRVFHDSKTGEEYLNVQIKDEFNFSEFKNPFAQEDFVSGMAWFANDIAYINTKMDVLTPFDIEISINIPINTESEKRQ